MSALVRLADQATDAEDNSSKASAGPAMAERKKDLNNDGVVMMTSPLNRQQPESRCQIDPRLAWAPHGNHLIAVYHNRVQASATKRGVEDRLHFNTTHG